MARYKIGQRVRYVRKQAPEDIKRLRDWRKANGYTEQSVHDIVPLGSEGTITGYNEWPEAAPDCYSVRFDCDPWDRQCKEYMLEPLTDCYQKTSWDALKEIWSPYERV